MHNKKITVLGEIVGRFKDLTGKLYGRWTVIEGITAHPSGRLDYALCRCSCGTVRPVRKDGLKSGGNRSCGCLQKEELLARLTTHGLSRHPLYKSIYNQFDRCNNPKSDAYADYGSRGIKFNFESVEKAILWVEENLGPKPTHKHTLDRIDNEGHYEPGNLRWATKAIQSSNQRSRKKQKNVTSKYLGVCWNNRRNRWRSYLRINGKQISLGSFRNEEEANQAVITAQLKLKYPLPQVQVS